MDDFAPAQMLEQVYISLGHVANALNIFDDCVGDELATLVELTEDPYAHHFENLYNSFRSVLLISIDRIDQIGERCNDYSSRLCIQKREANQKQT